MTSAQHDSIRAVIWEDGQLKLLDQRYLPRKYEHLTLTTADDTARAITDMVVRGAPAIGVTAAYGVVLSAQVHYARSPSDWKSGVNKDMQTLAASRPTAVNLFWALDRMGKLVDSLHTDPIEALTHEAMAIQEEDIAANYKMGDLGAEFIEPASSVLTHCNAGALATAGYGTALGVIRSAWKQGKLANVYADETRPWMQGSRLTAWELLQDDIPVTLESEGAAAHLMKLGKIDWVIVGSDRIAANGDVANKIGTYGLAVLARHHGVKFMVVAPSSTVDMSIPHGDQIPIEERAEDEVLNHNGQRVAADGARAWNPAFDVTPAELVDVIVTERGVVQNPSEEKMRKMMLG